MMADVHRISPHDFDHCVEGGSGAIPRDLEQLDLWLNDKVLQFLRFRSNICLLGPKTVPSEMEQLSVAKRLET
jgi:hypothetical protein